MTSGPYNIPPSGRVLRSIEIYRIHFRYVSNIVSSSSIVVLTKHSSQKTSDGTVHKPSSLGIRYPNRYRIPSEPEYRPRASYKDMFYLKFIESPSGALHSKKSGTTLYRACGTTSLADGDSGCCAGVAETLT